MWKNSKVLNTFQMHCVYIYTHDTSSNANIQYDQRLKTGSNSPEAECREPILSGNCFMMLGRYPIQIQFKFCFQCVVANSNSIHCLNLEIPN